MPGNTRDNTVALVKKYDTYKDGTNLWLHDGRLKPFTSAELDQILMPAIVEVAPAVKHLYMANTEIDDEKAKAIASHLPRLTHLKEVGLYGNQITDPTPLWESALRLPRLQYLWLSLDPRQSGLQLPPDVIAEAKQSASGNWDWGPMVQKVQKARQGPQIQ